MSCCEDQVVFLRPGRRPPQIVRRLCRLVVLVEPEHRNVHAIARIGEVVGVAAEKAGLILDDEHEADVGVDLVGIEVVRRPGVERHDLLRGAGLGPALDPLDRLLAGGHRVLRAHRRRDAGIHLGRHVLDALEHAERHAGHLQLVGSRRRVEPVLDEVLLRRAQPLRGGKADVVVGQHQAVGRHDGAGAPGEPNSRELQVVEPCVGDVELVLGLDGGLRDAVVRPESLVGQRRRGERGDDEEQRDERNAESSRVHVRTLSPFGE